MAIIYSYPRSTNILAADLVVGTTTVLVGGKQRNRTKNFSLGDISAFVIGNVPTGSLSRVNDTNVTLTLTGDPTDALLKDVGITVGWQGTLDDSRINSSVYWNLKQDTISLTTLGTSGPATFVGTVLNIPTYSGETYDWSLFADTGDVDPVNSGDQITISGGTGITTAIVAGTLTITNTGQAALVSGTNIKTVNGNSILGSGDLSTKGVHTLVKPFNATLSTSFALNATTITTTASFTNRIIVVPYIPASTITCSALYINITGAAVSALSRILIYSDNNGAPGTKIYESTNLDCSTTGIKTVTTTQTFVAGTIYWIGTHSSGSFTYSAIPAAALLPIISNQVAQITQYYTTATFGSAPSTFGAPLISALSVPFIGITI